ncbi:MULTISPECIES: hypothetical protein [Paraburkholderia]|uniref:Uncharacterized protein n=1 Tax=Paraburkholderia dioscoreae TaxID=2604047 RepID=A0A5Q4Z8T1_9BURK|nr:MULTISPECIES: hypothetical protein [Paraburkholderia]MDR8400625.1 hypothetical protein [Paraburkholderia sp. USG1]VVD26769.1 protein of unknown function [Paraburkholderia dioscoreae]
MKHGGATRRPGAGCQDEFASVMVLTPIFDTLRESRVFLRKVRQAPELRLLRCGFRQGSVLSLCKLYLAFGRALKTINPTALAPFTAGTTGAGLDGAVFIANWLDLRHGYPSPTVGRAARNKRLGACAKRQDFFAATCIWAADYRVKLNAWPAKWRAPGAIRSS